MNLDIHFPITDPTWIFFLVLVIILFAPIILERLHIPHIIGMILAGVVIGEHGFNILARDSSFELFGKVGLYYIMFLAGLEMNMEDFKSIRVKATVLGLLAFIFPLAIGIWTNLYLLDYATPEARAAGEDAIARQLASMDDKVRQISERLLARVRSGSRDVYC